MVFVIEFWFWKSEFCNLHDQIQKQEWSAKDRLNQETAHFHSINPGFDAEVAEKFLNGI